VIYVGIDPGLTGAIAFLGSPTLCDAVEDMPTYIASAGVVKREVNGQALAMLLRSAGHPDDLLVVLERTAAMPGQGVASMFSMGVTRGVVLGVIGTIGARMREVSPVTWKRAYALIGQEKGASRRLAIQRFPQLAERLAREKDHNRAEALLLALWLKQQQLD
jgi:hypothetical protein